MMDVVIRSRRGVDREMAAELLVEAREVATSYPNDPAVLSALAEAEYDAGNDAEAIAAAEAALALDPEQVNAYVQQGYALFRQAGDTEDFAERIAAYNQAVLPFLELNRLENDHPLPLYYFFRSFAESGRPITDNAKDGLTRAVQLAPFDRSLRIALVQQLLRDGEMERAAAQLRPIAFAPHGGSFSQRASEVIERIDEGAGPADVDQLLAVLFTRPASADGETGEEIED